ncbi:uncharacterized protein [Miscanthus floridulus]|uniref:uncharacterized protein isoform X2 n=1 Tax=Miscanthus floridulus TaxID=154761 RepID=UPI003459D0D5
MIPALELTDEEVLERLQKMLKGELGRNFTDPIPLDDLPTNVEARGSLAGASLTKRGGERIVLLLLHLLPRSLASRVLIQLELWWPWLRVRRKRMMMLPSLLIVSGHRIRVLLGLQYRLHRSCRRVAVIFLPLWFPL